MIIFIQYFNTYPMKLKDIDDFKKIDSQQFQIDLLQRPQRSDNR